MAPKNQNNQNPNPNPSDGNSGAGAAQDPPALPNFSEQFEKLTKQNEELLAQVQSNKHDIEALSGGLESGISKIVSFFTGTPGNGNQGGGQKPSEPAAGQAPSAPQGTPQGKQEPKAEPTKKSGGFGFFSWLFE